MGHVPYISSVQGCKVWCETTEILCILIFYAQLHDLCVHESPLASQFTLSRPEKAHKILKPLNP